MRTMAAWRERAQELRHETYALYLAWRDPRVPRLARWLAVAIVAYAFSPIDLIPDPIPILGYLDDLVLIPLGVALVLRLIPPPVMAECRQRVAAMADQRRPVNWVAASVVIAVWLLVAGLVAVWVLRMLRG